MDNPAFAALGVIILIATLLIVILVIRKRRGTKIIYEMVEVEINDEILDSNDVQRIIEPLWWIVSIYDGESKYYQDLEQFSVPQKYVFAIQWYIAEVYNGGHGQFYGNSTGIVWEEAMKGFKEIGLMENYRILKESADMIGGSPSKDRGKREQQLEKYDPDFEQLDEQVYELDSMIGELLLKYIREHRAEFYFKGIITRPKDPS